MRYLLLMLVCLVVGCGDPSVEVTCSLDTYFKNGACVPRPVPCGGCDAPTPVCDESTASCVGCLETPQCSKGTASRCEPTTHTCLACNADSDCAHIPDSPYCNSVTHACVPCECTNPVKPVCDPDTGECVECSIETETERCHGKSCDPGMHSCTDTPTGSVGLCYPCKADSECDQQDRFCVPMQLSPNDGQATQLGGHCLEEVPVTLECPNPFSSALARTSLSGVTGKSFCGIAEALTTCRAVLDLIEDTQPKPCTVDTDCGLSDLDDGLCRSIPGAGPAVCTYACDSGDHCPEEYHCPTGGGYCGQLE